MNVVRASLILLMLLPMVSEAQARRSRSERPVRKERTDRPARPESRSVRSPVVAGETRPTNFAFGAGLLFWQESILIKHPDSQSKMQTQLKGVGLHGEFVNPIQGRYWQQVFGADLSLGNLKGQGDQPGTPDRLDNQFWIMAGARAGLTYRTSPVSRAGIFVPVVYRKIQWKFNPGSSLTAEDKAFSVGLGGIFSLRMTKRDSLNLTLVHQHMWKTSLWSIAWNRDL